MPEAFASNELVGERLLIAKPAPPPGLILLKKHAPISQEPQAVFNSQPVFKRATPVRMLGDMVSAFNYFTVILFLCKRYESDLNGLKWLKLEIWFFSSHIPVGVASKRGGRLIGQFHAVTRRCPSSTQELPRIFQLQSITRKLPNVSRSTRYPTFRAWRRWKHHAHVKSENHCDMGRWLTISGQTHSHLFSYLISCLRKTENSSIKNKRSPLPLPLFFTLVKFVTTWKIMLCVFF